MKIIASDFDGTLYRNETITDRDRNAIEQWQKKGNLFGIVTGRSKGDIIRMLAENGIKTDFVIAYNGAGVFDSEGGVLYEEWFPRCEGKKLVDYAYATDFAFQDRRDSDIDPGDMSKSYQMYLKLETNEGAQQLAEILNKVFEGKFTSHINGHWINATKYGVSKATGIAHLAEIKGVAKEDVYAVGDYFNDLPMLEAFNGYVMASGHPEVIKIIGRTCEDIADLTELAYK